MTTAGDDPSAALLESLRDNTVSQVCLKLTSSTNLVALQAVCDVNTTLERVELLFDTDCADTEAKLSSFMQSISSRPKLRHLLLKSNADDEHLSQYYTMSLGLLLPILDQAAGLQSLHLGDIQLAGSTNDFASLEGGIRNHSSLNELTCTCWLSEQTRMTVGISADPLLRAIAASRTLHSLSFEPSFFGGDLTSVTVGMIGSLPTLQSLSISKCNIPSDSMVAMATAMRSNKTLSELRVTCRLEEPACLALAQCLRENGSLELLSIHNTFSNVQIDSANLDITATKSGTSGDTEDDSDETEVDDDHYLPVALTLQQSNRTLQHLTLHGTRLCKSSQDAFVEMMRENYSLIEVSLLGLTDSLQRTVDMFCRLNRSGRRRLMQTGGAPRQQWIETVTQVAGDLDCLFHLLSKKPSLCDLENLYTTGRDPQPRSLVKRDLQKEPTSKKRPRSP